MSTFSREELADFVWGELQGLKAGDRVVLSGQMGVGKTTLAQLLLMRLGLDVGAARGSPTFPVIHSYRIRELEVSHLDLYRVSSPRDLEERGALDVLFDPDQIVLVEWLGKFPELEVRLQNNFRVFWISLDFARDLPDRRVVTIRKG